MAVANIKKKEGDKWYVYSKDGKKKLGGPYDTEEEANDRLKQVEYFKRNQFVNVVFNSKPTLVRNDRMADRDYTVVPMVMLTEGVHAGSEGPLLYQASELAKRVELWNMKPVVDYHPAEPSACTPEILNTRQLGVIMNTKWDGKKNRLTAEAWLDTDRCDKVDKRIMEAVKNEEMLELSTGLFADSDETPGEWNGETYNGTLFNFGPDHLAILPDQKGACSIDDGAGFYRNTGESDMDEIILVDNAVDVTDQYLRFRQKDPNLFDPKSLRTIDISKKDGIKAVAGKLKDPPKGKEGSMVVQSYLFVKEDWKVADAKAWCKDHGLKNTALEVLNELSVGDMRCSLQKLISPILSGDGRVQYSWVEDIFPEEHYFVYSSDGVSGLLKQSYKVDGDKVVLEGTPEAVVRKVTYPPVKNTQGNLPDKADGDNERPNQDDKTKKSVRNSKENSRMDKEKIVGDLIANKTYAEEDREMLMALPDKVLEKLSAPVQNKEEPKPETKEEPVVTKNAEPEKPKTLDESLAGLHPDIQKVVRNAMVAEKREKDRLIDIITKNPRNTFTKEYLATKDAEELKSIANLAEAPKKDDDEPEIVRFNYSGQADPVQNADCSGIPVLEPPSYQKAKAG